MEPLVHRPYKRKAKAIITERKSVQLVYKLMRISFNVAAYLRGIFPGNVGVALNAFAKLHLTRLTNLPFPAPVLQNSDLSGYKVSGIQEQHP